MDEGDAGLLLEGIQILHDGVLGLAHVDDHLGSGAQEGLQIQLALAAVELAQQGQIVVLSGQVLLGARVHSSAMPTSLSGHRAKSTIWARGPETATLVISAGTSTVRPTESVKEAEPSSGWAGVDTAGAGSAEGLSAGAGPAAGGQP